MSTDQEPFQTATLQLLNGKTALSVVTFLNRDTRQKTMDVRRRGRELTIGHLDKA
jgi:hypothetical protein